MTISTPRGTSHLFFLNASRTNRRARFRSTEFPIFRVVVMPRRACSPEFGRTNAVKYRACNFRPCSYTCRNTSRLRMRSVLGNFSDASIGIRGQGSGVGGGIGINLLPRPLAPGTRLIMRRGKAFAPLCAASLEHELSPLRAHTHAKAVRFGAAAVVRLKSSLRHTIHLSINVSAEKIKAIGMRGWLSRLDEA